jgi:hypothetical protein
MDLPPDLEKAVRCWEARPMALVHSLLDGKLRDELGEEAERLLQEPVILLPFKVAEALYMKRQRDRNRRHNKAPAKPLFDEWREQI